MITTFILAAIAGFAIQKMFATVPAFYQEYTKGQRKSVILYIWAVVLLVAIGLHV